VTTTRGNREPLWKWQHVIAAVAAVAGVGTAVATILIVVTPRPGQPESPPGTSAVTGTAVDATATTADGARTLTTAAVPAPADGPMLWRDVPARKVEPCRSAAVNGGAAWQFTPVRVGGRDVEGIGCNLMSGGFGSVEFELDRAYATLTMVVGFASDSSSVEHRVRFEIVSDEQIYLEVPFTLGFGETRQLRLGIGGTSRLRLRVTETGSGAGAEAPSRPVFGDPRLTH
jgi:hypothetical protein